MLNPFEYLREFNFVSVVFRLVLSTAFGGALGINRARRGRAAGFRTYVCVCLGATLASLLGEYETAMLSTTWANIASELGVTTDVTRFAAQVINGIGFLGIGTIIVTGRREIKGLTTAVGLWTAACIGLCIGIGFYECVLIAGVLVFVCLMALPHFETAVIRQTTHMNVYVEFLSMDDVRGIIDAIKSQDVRVQEIEIVESPLREGRAHGAVFTLYLNRRRWHRHVIDTVADLDCVLLVEEV